MIWITGPEQTGRNKIGQHGYCRENGWRDDAGHEHWDSSKAWSQQLVKNNISYRFVRAAELADASALLNENTPLILDGVGCVSDAQFAAVKIYLLKGSIAWMALPFGTHDEKGVKRKIPLSDIVLKGRYKNLMIIDTALSAETVEKNNSCGKIFTCVATSKRR